MSLANAHFGPINILCANAGITDESASYPVWEMPAETWDRTYNTNVRGTFLTIKHFLRLAQQSQTGPGHGQELNNLAIVITGSECGKFGQAGHSEYASGKAGLQYGLVRTLKNEIVRLNKRARINAVAPGWVDTKLIEGRLDDPKEMWAEAQATVPLAKIAQPVDVARTVAFLASHRAAGHISGECISVDGGMEGRIVWKDGEISTHELNKSSTSIPQSLVPAAMQSASRSIKILVSVDFDAVSGWLGTGASPENTLSDYSSGFFAGRVGVPRLLKMFKRLGIASKLTWFIPGHSMESFPTETKAIVDSGAEIALHGYCHEGAPQLTETQEADVLEKCITLAEKLTGKKPVGYRAPLYQLRESTIKLLESHGFLYDTSLAHHDSQPYYLPRGGGTPIKPPIYDPDVKAKEWMHPLPQAQDDGEVVEIPCNWYMEDMTPMQFWPHTNNSQGYVDARVIEHMWQQRFEFLMQELNDEGDEGLTVFPLVLHPDTSGMAHVLPMIEKFLTWVIAKGAKAEFMTFEDAAGKWRNMRSSK
jgi:NAD(P)-dependent dehydrogenase (short-subunit alcohol dehydrogenase family)/peptidoglycan/xylan/chitin deacetylase (PgdA/CDA1 family)